MTPRLFGWSLVASLAGFLFGFDTVVISGAEQAIQQLWGLSDFAHGAAVGAALWGTVLGALVGSVPTDRLGRRNTLIGVGVLYFVSAVGSGIAPEVITFALARAVGGVGVGIATVAAPLFIAEISPPARRGLLTCLFQFNIVAGILAAYLSNALLNGVGPDAWRWMLGVEAIPAAVFTVLALGLPESPRWLLGRGGRDAEALKVLAAVNPTLSPAELDDLAETIRKAAVETGPRSHFWSRRLRRPIALAFLIAFFNQLSGINALLYYAPRVFALAGLGEQAALLQSVGVGVTMFVFTFVGLMLIDRLGRKTLLVVGSLGYIVSLGLVAWGFFTDHYAIIPPSIFGFIAAHGIGQGAVIWVFISEIFPTRDRAAGQSLGSTTHWVFAALVSTTFPSFVGEFGPGLAFAGFCGMMVLQLVWVILFVPETRGVPLEALGHKLEDA
jgi:SP family arabinose:H+ symporter-like MFS transporter